MIAEEFHADAMADFDRHRFGLAYNKFKTAQTRFVGMSLFVRGASCHSAATACLTEIRDGITYHEAQLQSFRDMLEETK